MILKYFLCITLLLSVQNGHGSEHEEIYDHNRINNTRVSYIRNLNWEISTISQNRKYRIRMVSELYEKLLKDENSLPEKITSLSRWIKFDYEEEHPGLTTVSFKRFQEDLKILGISQQEYTEDRNGPSPNPLNTSQDVHHLVQASETDKDILKNNTKEWLKTILN